VAEEVGEQPPSGLPGLDPRWSRTVRVLDADGIDRRWHLLDNRAEPTAGTMLCLHGNPTWSYLWRRFVAAAPPGWRVLAPDQLGMGWSQRLPTPRRMADRIEDLNRLTEALGVDGPVVLVAHDWGGPIALGWALAHLGQVAGVILTNTGVALPGDAAPPLIRLARSPVLQRTVCVSTPVFVRSATALSRPPLPADVRAALASPYGSASLRGAIGDFVADIPVEPEHPTRAPLERVAGGLAELRDVPALLLWGPRDPVFSERYLQDLAERLPHAAIHRYANASHLVTEDAPEAAEHAWTWVRDQVEQTAPAAEEVERGDSPTLWAGLTARAEDPAVATVELSADGRTVTSFADLERRVVALAGGLADVGVGPGDRIALLVRPGLDLTASVYACWRVGATIVLADAGLGLRNLGAALRSAAPDHLIAIPAGMAVAAALRVPGQRIVAGSVSAAARRLLRVDHSLEELAARRALRPRPEHQAPEARGSADRDSPGVQSAEAAVLFTSGATGPAKGVVYQQHQLRAQLDLIRLVMRIGPDDRLVAAFAPFALYGPALGVAAAAPDMDVTRPATLTAAALTEAVRAIDATVIFASPAALRNVAETAEQLDAEQRSVLAGVRTVLSAGAPVPVSLLRRVQALVPNAELHTPYGMTEALPVTDISLAQIEAAGSGNGVCVGTAVPGVQIRISALDDAAQADGPLTSEPEVTGEICVSGPQVKQRYDRLWATERESSRNPGWHRTGDVGHFDVEGRLWVEGRLVHVIKAASGPLTPVGIEQRVEAVPGVRAAAAVGVGPAGTQQLCLVLVPEQASRGPLADPELAAAVREAAGVPIAAVLVVAALPVDIRHSSKVDRLRLARWAERVLSGGRVGRP
jgi:olefin beta-lactone synthetase